MDKAIREELKHDEIQDVLISVAQNKQKVMLYGGIALAAVLLVAGYFWYQDRASTERQTVLAQALRVRDGQIGTPTGPEDPRMWFGSLADKQASLRKSLLDVMSKYPGSDEASMAEYHLGVLSADEGKAQEAEQHFNEAAKGSSDYASAARWALQEIYAGDGRTKQAEEILRSFVANPTILISKEQATIELAKMIAASKPDEARKLVEPLSRLDAAERGAVTRYAQGVLVTLPGGIVPAANSNSSSVEQNRAKSAPVTK